MLPQQLTPFNGELEINLVDSAGAAVEVSTLDDVKILLLVNGVVKLKFKQTADEGTGWLAWMEGDGDAPTSVKCPVTEEQTNAWRGLVTADVEEVGGDMPFIYQLPLFTAVKSAFTAQPAPVVNPISFTTSFSCDVQKQLHFSCTITAPAGNYIIEVKVKDEWRRLYDGYVEKGSDDVTYTKSISPLKQIAAGNYPLRVINAITGSSSEEQPIYLPNCMRGKFENSEMSK